MNDNMMKKFFLFAAILGCMSLNVNAQSVLVNGVRWATCNVDAPGTFTKSPDDAGMFYQWNSKVAWPASGGIRDWRSVSVDIFDEEGHIYYLWGDENDPSPKGYHVPTIDEVASLFDKDKVACIRTTRNGKLGCKFTDRSNGNSIFIPACGFRGGRNGTWEGNGSLEYSSMMYWTVPQMVGSDILTCFTISEDDYGVLSGGVIQTAFGNPVKALPMRCVED